MRFAHPLSLAFATLMALPAYADGELNLYSSRHYDTDERLYSDFTEATGITINRIEGNADELIARIQAEGQNSPADVLLTVDTSRLKRAKDLKRAAIRGQRHPGKTHSGLPTGCRQRMVRFFAAGADYLL